MYYNMRTRPQGTSAMNWGPVRGVEELAHSSLVWYFLIGIWKAGKTYFRRYPSYDYKGQKRLRILEGNRVWQTCMIWKKKASRNSSNYSLSLSRLHGWFLSVCLPTWPLQSTPHFSRWYPSSLWFCCTILSTTPSPFPNQSRLLITGLLEGFWVSSHLWTHRFDFYTHGSLPFYFPMSSEESHWSSLAFWARITVANHQCPAALGQRTTRCANRWKVEGSWGGIPQSRASAGGEEVAEEW